ncbi:hemerythrin domain-containing protein [Rhodococcus sp. USK10]|uniref:hemerythrin domain-containing protein n=1 Tax=Rhodococcus sp. USK10 TaxID=2789739 RepID=UPI001C5EF1F1|nr:hemerythrin domain-containing protein [Rhodococcus sp. USK10]QYB02444.1 hemerythrin domain-containing protein [Rhodococcus sp. USK10]
MTTPTAHTTRPDTREMVVVHNCFRRQFAALPALVRRVPAGDTARAAEVVAFFEELATALHHHHSSEDDLLWPKLLDRAPTDAALVLRMEEQHERISELLSLAQSQGAAFTADAVDGEPLAKTLTALSAALGEHLGEEERHILPMAEQFMTLAEWQEMGDRGRASIPKDRLLVFLGFILQGATPEERRMFLSEMPFAARMAWSILGRRAFRKDYRRIYRTEPAAF